ncbi:MarR family transcriptional regulator [Streptomyces decoyicus]|uniref:MarR family winged helix-turn-helix transcriptional regulator n=1 Tax=Streptomyces decoyicus TaxID=249567 RepID=UPI002E177B95|nr:MarR family transcriptional regulator [Streptomyces decoyicus]
MPDPATPPPPSEVAERFFAVTKLLRKRANDGLRAQGLTMARGKLLAVLDRAGPVRISAIAAKLGIAARSVTEAVDALERDGLVRRAPDPTDRRAVLVTLTDRGATVIHETEGPRRAVVNGLFSALDTEDRAELLRLLDILGRAAQESEPPGGT